MSVRGHRKNTQTGSFVNYCFSKNNFLNHSIVYVIERSTIKAYISRTVGEAKMTRSTF